MRVVRLHFNRINMQRGNKNVWTVHTSGKCHQVQHVKAWVPLETVFNKDGRQPRAFLKGVAGVHVHKGTAYLVDDQSYQRMDDDEYFEAYQ